LRSVRAAPSFRAVSEFGVYVHIPFCRARCDYCAFATYTDKDPLMERYAAACVTEIRHAVDAGDLPEATSVFFGGGTPSRLDPDLLVGILAAIPKSDDCEVTVECNPEDAPRCLGTFAGAGVNRISLGVQSVHDHVLANLGRHIEVTVVERAVAELLAIGFTSWNLDLIFGAATESDEDWEGSLARVLEFAPPHVSAYALTVEPGTPLALDPARHPDDDVQARRYERADEVLSAAGYRWEEISNWARPGHECRHNHLYWRQGDYLGIGSAAHSHRAGTRWWNVRTPERYLAAIETGARARGGDEVLTAEQREFEALALSLRTRQGVPSSALDENPDLDGFVRHDAGRAVLTVRGRLLANAVTGSLRTGSGRDGERRASAPGVLGVSANY
jgi:oxygen-independent coproporphyrinogen-3 oxidase